MSTPDATDVTNRIWRVARNDTTSLERIRFSGPSTVLPSVFAVTSLAAGCVGATTLAADELWRSRGGPSPATLTIDRRAAALSFRSERYLRRDGDTVTAWDDLSGYYRTADNGWVQLHCNYPHHRLGVLNILGCEENRDAVEATISSQWTGQDLEDALAADGMCATMLRTRGEWLDHPQGRTLASLPLFEIDEIENADPRPLAKAPRPLEGVRVLDLTRVIAGPTTGRILAQHGAEVLKVNASHLPAIELCVIDSGFGKRSCHLDLDVPEDHRTFLSLVDSADVLVQGYRPGGLTERGLGPRELTERRPGLVYVSLSAYSHLGPWSDRRGFDSLTQTAIGIGAAGAQALGVEGSRPLPCQALDHGTGWLMAFATISALHRRQSSGGSWHVRASLAQTGTFLAGLGPTNDLDIADPSYDDVRDLVTNTPSSFGELSHLRSVGRLDRPGDYDSAPVQLGSDPPRWL